MTVLSNVKNEIESIQGVHRSHHAEKRVQNTVKSLRFMLYPALYDRFARFGPVRGTHDSSQSREEPDEGNLSCPVLN
jgi:hypothetical protein